MKSILQKSQLTNEELKSVFKGDQESFSSLMKEALDFRPLKYEIKNISDHIYDTISKAFQIMLEKMIYEEFLDFLECIADKGINPSRNGTYERKIRTYLGDYVISIPRARYENFKTSFLEKYGHDIGDIDRKVIDLYLSGLTAEETAQTISKITNIGISKEKICEIVRNTLGDALKFNFDEIEDCPIVFMDATYIPIKKSYFAGKTVEKNGIFVALGVTPSGTKKILGFTFGETEQIDRWKYFLRTLKDRGLKNPKLFVTDGLRGMPEAIREIYPAAKHQRCLVHFQRNLCSYVNRADRKQICDDFKNVISKNSKEEAEIEFKNFTNFWSSKYRFIRNMFNRIDDNIFTFYSFPEGIRKAITTTNVIEGFNSKLKRETRKRIIANSEDNGIIIVASICRSYNKSCGLRLFSGLTTVNKSIREELGFSF